MQEQELSLRLAETETRSRGNSKRIDRLESRQENFEKLVTSVSLVCSEQEHIKQDLQEIKTDVKTLTGKAGKRWDSMMEKVLFLLMGGIVAFLLSQWGMA